MFPRNLRKDVSVSGQSKLSLFLATGRISQLKNVQMCFTRSGHIPNKGNQRNSFQHCSIYMCYRWKRKIFSPVALAYNHKCLCYVSFQLWEVGPKHLLAPIGFTHAANLAGVLEEQQGAALDRDEPLSAIKNDHTSLLCSSEGDNTM